MKKTMGIFKTVAFVFATLLLGNSAWGQTQLFLEDFEDATYIYTTSVAEFSDGDFDYFTSTVNNAIGGVSFTNIQGSGYFAAQDIDGEGATLPVSFNIDDINISGYTDITFKVYLAEDDDGSNENWDAADYVHFTYDIDNTNSYSNLLWIESSGGTNTEPAIDTDFDGTGDGAAITDEFIQYSVSIPSTGNDLDIQIEIDLNSGDEDIAIDHIEVYGTSTGPTINLSASSLTGFSYEEGSGPSAEQTFTVEGSNLTDDIALSASTNYEISESSGSGFGSSISLGQSGGSVSTTTIYVRLKSGLSIGTYVEDITASSSGATNQTVTCDGSVTAIGVSGCSNDLIISEYGEGSANNKYIEIYNGTGSSVDLSQYILKQSYGGAGWDTDPNSCYNMPLSGTLAYEEVFVIAASDADASILAEADMTVTYNNSVQGGKIVFFTGNDAIGLFNGTTLIDLFGDPTSGSIIPVAGYSTYGQDHTIVRKSNVYDGNTDWTSSSGTNTTDSEWVGYAQDTWSYLGSHNMLACDPIITISPSSLSDFNYSVGNGPSAEQSFTISGSNLNANISIAAPTNYEISTGTGGAFVATDPITLTESGGDVAETTIYVRLKSGLLGGEYNNVDITATSTDATDQTVTCSGYVCGTPSSEATSLNFPNTQYDQMDVSWTAGDGENHLVVASTSPITGAPSDNTSYTADANFGDGATLNAGEYVVYAGSATSFTMTGLNSDTQYYFKIFEYNCESGNEQYLTGSPLSGDETTVANIPAVTGFDVTCTTETTATVEWTNPSSGDWSGVIIAIRNSTLEVHTLSDDPATVSADPAFGSGHEFGTTTPYSYVVYKGSGTSVTITGLTAGQEYSLKAISYYGSLIGDETTTTISSLEISEVTAASATTENSQTNLSWSNPGACYDEILIVGHEGSSVSASPSGDGSAYTANGSFGSGTDIGTNEYVIYQGTSTSVNVTNLTNGNTYYFTIFVRVGTEWSAGVEIIANPSEVTDFIPGDLAIIAVNTNYQGHATLGDFEEFTFVAFKDIAVGTSIDFTENGWERSITDRWGTTEGAIRLTREAGGSVPAGTSVTVVMHGVNGTDASHFDIYINGTDELAAGNWSITELNPTKGSGFNLNSEDDIWIMQGGSWIENDNSSSPSYHDDEYTGYVLYGWTATGWPGGDPAGSTEFSNLYPACECFNTNVSGMSNHSKVKYTGAMTDASKLDWINRFNDEGNWTGYLDDTDYDAGGPDYRNNGISIGVLGGGFESGRWTASYNTDWFNCRNWQNLTVPDENTDVLVSPTYASGEAEVNNFNTENALCHDITVEPGIELDFHDNTLEVHGDFNNQADVLGTWNSTLILAADEAVNITTNGVSMNNVTINGSGTFNLQDDFVLDGVLTLTSGVVSTGTNMLHVDNTDVAAITDQNANSYINGNLRRSANGAGLFEFPVGDDSNYELAEVDINSASGLTHLDAHFASADLGPTSIGGLGLVVDGTPLVSVLDAGYWQVEPNAGATVDYDIILNERGASNAAPVAAQHAVVKRDDAGSDWELQGNHDNATQSINGSVVTAQVSGLSGFSQFAIARSNQFPLAVELTSFDVTCQSGGVLIEWTTASEENSDYFRIEYAADAKSWKTIDKVLAFGTTNQQQEYQFLLEDVPETGYFRLSEVDADGTITSYKPAYINCSNGEQAEFTLAPNPARTTTILKAQNASADFYLVRISDMQGRLVKTVSWENPAEQSLNLNLQPLQSGVYSVLVYNQAEANRLKLVVRK